MAPLYLVSVEIVFVLQQKRRCLHVVLFGGYVKRREMDFATRVVLQQNRDDSVVTLLQCNRQRSEAILKLVQFTAT